MSNNQVVLNPTSESSPATIERASRLASLDGKTVALLNISKPRGDIFLDRVEEKLGAAGVATKRYTKPTFTKPAPVDLRHEITEQCDAVIEALAD